MRPLPYLERRRILEDLRLDAAQWRVPEAFEDGERCGRRSASTNQNRAYWRFELERDARSPRRERRLLVPLPAARIPAPAVFPGAAPFPTTKRR